MIDFLAINLRGYSSEWSTIWGVTKCRSCLVLALRGAMTIDMNTKGIGVEAIATGVHMFVLTI